MLGLLGTEGAGVLGLFGTGAGVLVLLRTGAGLFNELVTEEVVEFDVTVTFCLGSPTKM